MQFDIITIFPKAFGYLEQSILGRALKSGKIKVKIHDLRKWTTDKHRTVDDRPYGGGPGMVMKVEPLHKAIKAIKKSKKVKVVLFSAKGEKFTQTKARQLQKYHQIILIAGRYEGVDERILKWVDVELSIGDYVLTGGELPAMVVIDAVGRLQSGVLGKRESALEESHRRPGWLEYPHYTRPEVFKGRRVPVALLSGDHRKIKIWRQHHARQRI
ncbi:tRNA (guanosine(37)-N1)-methyltransferase TrmD [Candidatus Parcubacteria bacterium]|jgi:tRNA (guanine37-N1)-methyltransferase|nr:MAG: tRNA (guanosine(37)-N1)-methyltransferase TrmD [Candidatus Parcubacteria bacterium]